MKLSEELEQCVLGLMLKGEMNVAEVEREDFSKTGQQCWQAVQFMDSASDPPFTAKEMYATALELFGGDRQTLAPYVKKVIKAKSTNATKELYLNVKRKLIALHTIETLSNQLAEGKFDFEVCKTGLLVPSGEPIRALSDAQGDSLVESLEGLSLKDLFPQLHEATGGLIGMWTIGGGPGLGKSTLAIEVAIHLSQFKPVLYYDFENGTHVILYRLGKVFGNARTVKEKTKNLYLRENIKTLSEDLQSIGKPTLIVIDSFQSIPTRTLQRRQDLEGWLSKLEAYKKEGHSILLVSEVNRAEYGHVTGKGYKETGEIEYKSDVAIEIAGDSTTPELHITKNRHAFTKGHVCTLMRVNELWFKEIAGDSSLEGL